MFRVAIVEDEILEIETLKAQLKKYENEYASKFDITTYQNGIEFLEGYQPKYDLIFMDIQMPHMDGMKAAQKLRYIDQSTTLIFVTNMANMAIKGYEVQAFDFIVKPLHYESLVMKMKRFEMKFASEKTDKVMIQQNGIGICLTTREIKYIEVLNHQLIYYTVSGTYTTYGTLSQMVTELQDKGFSQCKSCYLVNLRFVKKVEKYTVVVDDKELQISRPKKKAFMEALNNYIGG